MHCAYHPKDLNSGENQDSHLVDDYYAVKMTMYVDNSAEIKLLEGRRKYYTSGGLKRYLPYVLSALCGALCALTAGMTYVATRDHGEGQIVVSNQVYLPLFRRFLILS